MKNLTDISLKRPVTVLMVFTCLLIVGSISSRLLPLEYFPDIDEPDIDIWIPYPNSTPEEVERLITRPAEEVLSTISGITEMTSRSMADGSDIEIVFSFGSETDIKGLETREKLESIRHLLPDDLERIYVQQESSADMPLMNLRISSDRDLSGSYEMLNRNLKRRIERLEGVSSVELYGVQKKEINVRLHAHRLYEHQININQLTETLRQSNFSLSAGRISDAGRRYRVRPLGEFNQVGDIGDLIIGANNLRLRDIAEVSYESPEMDHARHLDRKFAVGLEIRKEGGANTVATARRIRAEIGEIGKIPEMKGIRIFYMDDQAEGILSSLNELLKSGMLGALLAILVLYFFLRRFSTTMIVALAVPFSLLVTLAFLYFLGLTLNILSMMGLMLAVGMLVDNAVVVTESVHRHQLRDADPLRATRTGVKEVATAVTAGTLTTIIVFLPGMISAKDEVSIYLTHVAVTICVAMVASLFISQTIVPLLTSRLKPRTVKQTAGSAQGLLDAYQVILRWTLKHRGWTALLIILTLASVAIPFSIVKFDMGDNVQDRRFRLHYNLNGSYSLEKIEQAVDQIEEYLYANQAEFEIKSVYTYWNHNFASSTILLTEGDEAEKSMEEIRELIRQNLPRIPIANPSFDWRQRGGRSSNLRITLAGKSSEMLSRISREVSWTLSQVPGLVEVRSEAERGEEEVRVRVDRERARLYGFDTAEVARAVSTAIRGQNLRRFRGPEGEIDVRLRFQENDRQTLEQLMNLPLMTAAGRPVKLSTLADFETGRGPQSIFREDRTTLMGVTIHLEKGLTIGDARSRIAGVMDRYQLPPGYSWGFGRSFNDDDEVFNNLLNNILLALLMIYLLMAALFESLSYPAAIWTSIIFSIVGVFWFFMVTGTTFSMMAMIGILILIGVVVNNGIVLIDHINQLRAAGLTREEAILQGGRDRLRPILMTAGTTVLGLLPLCIGTTQIGGDGPPYFPMARAIVGGLAFSTFVTLVMLPSIYLGIDNLRIWARRIWQEATDKKAQEAVS